MSDHNERPATSPHTLFDDLAHTPMQHFALYFYAALLRILARAVRTYRSEQAVLEAMPYLDGYVAQVNALGIVGLGSPDVCAGWRDARPAQSSTRCR